MIVKKMVKDNVWVEKEDQTYWLVVKLDNGVKRVEVEPSVGQKLFVKGGKEVAEKLIASLSLDGVAASGDMFIQTSAPASGTLIEPAAGAPVGIGVVDYDKKFDSWQTTRLVEATELFQPVRGTSDGSRYFCVGSFGDGAVKMAMRVKPKGSDEWFACSVRFEAENGDDLSKIVVPHQAFSVKTTNGVVYLSGHLDVSDPEILYYLVFSAVMRVFRKYDFPNLPNIASIIGRGV